MLDPSAEDGTLLDAGIQHAGHAHVDTEDRLRQSLRARVETPDGLAEELPVFWILELHLGRGRPLRGRSRNSAEGDRAPARGVSNDAVRRVTLGGRHPPPLGSGCNEHGTGRGTRLAQIILGLPYRAAAPGAHADVTPVVGHMVVGGGVLGTHLGPVAFQLLRHQHGQRGEDPLPHLGAGDPDHDSVVGVNQDPGIHLDWLICFTVGIGQARCEWDMESQQQSTGRTGAAHDECPAAEIDRLAHGLFLPQDLAAWWMACRIRL